MRRSRLKVTDRGTGEDSPLASALNAVCPYYTMFPIEFPLERLRGAKPGETVLDPFCGRGSTSFAARILKLYSLGIDSNPVATAIAQAKVAATTPGRVIEACHRILNDFGEEPDIPKGEFWDRCFDPHTLLQLCMLREALMRECSSPTRQALRALLLGRLHGPRNVNPPYSYCSNQMPRTYAAKPGYAVKFWRKRRLTPPFIDVLDVVARKAHHFFSNAAAAGRGVVVMGDSRTVDLRAHLPSRSRASWVVTSPPYYGMRTYIPDQWLRYWFVGGPEAVPYQFTGQLSHTSPEEFAEELGAVWSNVANACRTGARLIVRFGALRDRDYDARDILHMSLRKADAGWRVLTIRCAGSAAAGRRQADQFLTKRSEPLNEFDLFARLDR